jgi:hypothetical protein
VEHGVAFAVAGHFQLDVDLERISGGRAIHLHTVIDDQIGRNKGVHGRRITTGPGQGGTHRRQIDQGGHAGEILEDHPGGHQGYCLGADLVRLPGGKVVDISIAHQALRVMAQQIFQENTQAVGQALDRAVTETLQGLDRKDGVCRAVHLQRGPGIELVEFLGCAHGVFLRMMGQW